MIAMRRNSPDSTLPSKKQELSSAVSLSSSDTAEPAHLVLNLLEDSTIHGYIFGAIIAESRNGIVYRCDEADKGKSVPPAPPVYVCKVLKKVDPDQLESQKEREEAKRRNESREREVKIACEVHHKNILGIHYSFETPEASFLIMPYMQGGTLFDKIVKRVKFTEAEQRRILHEVACGVEYLHSRGICHRDLKPENIFCSGEERNFHVVVADFGLSRFFGRDELMKTDCGTVRYAAPEIYQHKDYYTEACDIWSYGVVAFTFLTGFFPFDDPVESYVPYKICNLDFDRSKMKHLSAEAQAFIERLLNKDPKARPTASYLVHEDPWLTATDEPDAESPSTPKESRETKEQ